MSFVVIGLKKTIFLSMILFILYIISCSYLEKEFEKESWFLFSEVKSMKME